MDGKLYRDASATFGRLHYRAKSDRFDAASVSEGRDTMFRLINSASQTEERPNRPSAPIVAPTTCEVADIRCRKNSLAS